MKLPNLLNSQALLNFRAFSRTTHSASSYNVQSTSSQTQEARSTLTQTTSRVNLVRYTPFPSASFVAQRNDLPLESISSRIDAQAIVNSQSAGISTRLAGAINSTGTASLVEPILTQVSSLPSLVNTNSMLPSSNDDHRAAPLLADNLPINSSINHLNNNLGASSTNSRLDSLSSSSSQNLSMPKVKNMAWISKANIDASLTIKDKQNIVEKAVIAGSPYNQKFTMNGTEHTLTGYPKWAVSKATLPNITKDTEIHREDKMLIDPKTGFVATIMQNSETQEVKIVFGGTTSGEVAGGLVKRNKGNLGIIKQQWKANLQSALANKIPECYQQASQVVTNLRELMAQDDNLKCYELVCTGHSLGAGMAQWAAAMNSSKDNIIKADCFCSAQLNSKMLSEIQTKHHSTGALPKVLAAIQHYKIKGDVVPHMNKTMPRFLSNIGKSTTIPHQRIDKLGGNTRIGYHDRFIEHTKAWADKKTS